MAKKGNNKRIRQMMKDLDKALGTAPKEAEKKAA